MRKFVYGVLAAGIVTVVAWGVNYSNPDIYGLGSIQDEVINYSNPDIYG
ncbi:hypothetical protein [Bacillus sp. XF8]|nr:hypothetical protein [Bacillus sp. XF8]MBO1579917.1 hypothetical protein [Bacillus sp. XF8]